MEFYAKYQQTMLGNFRKRSIHFNQQIFQANFPILKDDKEKLHLIMNFDH